MKSFVAERVEIDLELTTLEEATRAEIDGDKPVPILLAIKPTLVLSATKVTSIVKEWTVLEDKRKEEGEVVPFDVMAVELAMLYDKPKEWWLDNFNTNTLNNILMHVAGELAGVKKSSKSSKQSSRSDTTK